MLSQHTENLIATWQSAGLQVVFTNGCFDLLHPGHVDYLRAAARLGDRLILGLNSDASIRRLKGPARPINPLEDRTIMLEAFAFIDLVIPFEEDTPQRLIEAVKPNVLCKGGDYDLSTIIGADFVMEHGGTVEVIPFLPGYSSSQLIDKIMKANT